MNHSEKCKKACENYDKGKCPLDWENCNSFAKNKSVKDRIKTSKFNTNIYVSNGIRKADDVINSFLGRGY